MTSSKTPYQDLFERSADAILIIQGEVFVDCNQAAVEMLRCSSREEVLSTHPSQLSPPTQPDGRESFEKANEMISLAFEKGNHRFEWTHRRADGEEFPVEVLLTAVEGEASTTLHVVWRDITERRRLEDQLRLAQKLEAVGKLAGGIAHDFNNYLVVILGHVELAQDIMGANSRVGPHLKAIRGASQRAAGLVKQLLAFGKKQPHLVRVVELNTLLEGSGDLLDRLTGEHLELRTRLWGSPLLVKVDPGQIEQVLMNLATNAKDACPGGGVLTITTEKLLIGSGGKGNHDGLAPGDYAMVSFTDSGTGMAPETIERAFDPFFTTKERGRGTGLGLATVYGIAEQSQGSVLIESDLGVGTTVRLFLPLATEEPLQEDEPPALSQTTGGEEKILVVEDDAYVRGLIMKTLRLDGYQVIPAADGAEGMEAFLSDPEGIDMIVTDVIMPRTNGPTMMAELRALGFDLPALFISGYTDDDLSDLREMGPDVDFMEKPFSPRDLRERVRRRLDGVRTESAEPDGSS